MTIRTATREFVLESDATLQRALDNRIASAGHRVAPQRMLVRRLRSGVLLLLASAFVGAVALAGPSERIDAVARVIVATLLGAAFGSILATAAVAVGHRTVRDWSTRALDVAVASVYLVILAPLLAITGIAILLERPRLPIVFSIPRVGRFGVVYRMYRFRTLVVDQTGQPRITRVGRLLRRTSIDEMPVLINVLWGDMSLVGPRPRSPRTLITGTDHIFSVRPGVLSPAVLQNAPTWEAAEAIEAEYAATKSLLTDIAVVVRTVGALFRFRR